ncbi:MFS transporter, NNP family, nitrate/nitrite transporter [Chitinophaga terrae (ex Kim and Jung 2007)]|jgi:NNP family nitrate/nitrite transporter-like MFS transporter|uniref:Nitrate/nitrite transporter n=1 Tax=Chitinophaga terrae (ex Kim and Jung 2007) TaxID=408074 RepID=A0A1H3XDM9_9BACT|nr:NarK family nitrate/nitrite MFS transporter [Chitinophaga terrae (ex Kim and Jung 2007)]GEP89816.1 MFS transporter [Chitinophaga terrae (ex Kim and Jung 2007)]SDZ96712.1 MFS transporter, NNP family, nitrate/nitrite transporter [Chitinophaga terrae (ex Kim and Jung 2007)]
MSAPLNELKIFSIRSVQMRTFHITWLMFFVCFFGWFGLAPLMPTIRTDLGLSKSQVGNIIIASVSGTIVARLVIGRLCDIWGPRLTAIRLLLVGAVPVMLVGLAHDYTTFLLFRLCISVIGASFVITQFHTSLMFAPAIKGTANAVTGGWGNLGGGVTNMVMPLIFAAITGFGYTPAQAWRYAMIVPGIMMLIVAWLYYRYTQDTPAGNFRDLPSHQQKQKTDWSILADWRVWALTFSYAMCFGMEITFDNVAALHFTDSFGLAQERAGFLAGIFGFMNLFARAIGGILSDKAGKKYGMNGKGRLLALLLVAEGIGLLFFAQAGSLTMAIISMLSFAFFLKMANGATYGIVPFINEKNVGLVSGVVGAGGNLGGMMFGFLFKSENISYAMAFRYIGIVVVLVGLVVLITRFYKSADQPKRTLAVPEYL